MRGGLLTGDANFPLRTFPAAPAVHRGIVLPRIWEWGVPLHACTPCMGGCSPRSPRPVLRPRLVIECKSSSVHAVHAVHCLAPLPRPHACLPSALLPQEASRCFGKHSRIEGGCALKAERIARQLSALLLATTLGPWLPDSVAQELSGAVWRHTLFCVHPALDPRAALPLHQWSGRSPQTASLLKAPPPAPPSRCPLPLPPHRRRGHGLHPAGPRHPPRHERRLLPPAHLGGEFI